MEQNRELRNKPTLIQSIYMDSLFCSIHLRVYFCAEPACSAGDPGSIPESGRYPGEGMGNALQYSCLENPMDKGAWQATTSRLTHQWKKLDTEWIKEYRENNTQRQPLVTWWIISSHCFLDIYLLTHRQHSLVLLSRYSSFLLVILTHMR